jgi:hypothetical protein
VSGKATSNSASVKAVISCLTISMFSCSLPHGPSRTMPMLMAGLAKEGETTISRDNNNIIDELN